MSPNPGILAVVLFMGTIAGGCKKETAERDVGGGQSAPERADKSAAATQSAGNLTSPPAPSEAGTQLYVDRLTLDLPASWVSETPASSMRKAQLRLPGSRPGQDAELVIYHFGKGPGAGGSVEMNFERWIGQFAREDGRDPKEAANIDQRTIGGVTVHTIDISGRYVAPLMPGQPNKHDKPDHRLLGAILVTPDGNYFSKLVGPTSTVAGHETAYRSFLESLTWQGSE